jgi:lipopolysaccharide export system protein LptA
MLRVTTWQRKARLIIAIAGVAFAVVVVFAFRKRDPGASSAAVAPADPKAVVESANGLNFRVNLNQETVRVEYGTASSYSDGSSKLSDVTITTVRDGGRTFKITGKQADVGQNESSFNIVGDVRICEEPTRENKRASAMCPTASDGMELRTERATYTDADGLVRATGPVQLLRGRTTGSGVGFVYSKTADLLTILDQAVVNVTPDEHGAGAMEVVAKRADFNRPQKTIRFDGGVTVKRGDETITADTGTAHLTADEQRLEAVELEGNAVTSAAKSVVGGLKGLSGHGINLKYASDGQTLEHAAVTGEAVIRVTAERNQSDRQITANTLDITLAPDGATPTVLAARENVQLILPAEGAAPGRTIRAPALDSQGEPGRGLTKAHFSGGVQFRERGGDVDRSAQSGTLDATLAPGLSEIEEARFTKAVRFDQGPMTATAASARYVFGKGTLELSGSEPAFPTPHVVNDRISVYSTRIDVTLEGPVVKATTAVKSELKPPKKDAAQTKLPSMFKQDQIVTATAGELLYDGRASEATYRDAAQVWQGETSIKAASITLNEQNGNLTANGSVVTTITLEQEGKDKKKERVPSMATSNEFQYDESARRATYLGEAHVHGPQGDMTADKVELYLKPSGDELERAEAYESVTLRDQNQETRGLRMTYFSAGERYVVTGTPATIKDECGRETMGRTVTFDKVTDRIVVDGNAGTRTQTKGGADCK